MLLYLPFWIFLLLVNHMKWNNLTDSPLSKCWVVTWGQVTQFNWGINVNVFSVNVKKEQKKNKEKERESLLFTGLYDMRKINELLRAHFLSICLSFSICLPTLATQHLCLLKTHCLFFSIQFSTLTLTIPCASGKVHPPLPNVCVCADLFSIDCAVLLLLEWML